MHAIYIYADLQQFLRSNGRPVNNDIYLIHGHVGPPAVFSHTFRVISTKYSRREVSTSTYRSLQIFYGSLLRWSVILILTWNRACIDSLNSICMYIVLCYVQGDHSPDNAKFSDNSTTFPWLFAAFLPMLCATHMPVLVLLSVVGVGMQQFMIRNQNKMHKLSKIKNGCKYAANNKVLGHFSPTLPWLLVKSLTFPWQLSKSLTFPGFPDKWSPCMYLCQ